jgi:cyclopropane fatty-acyl-phospholipid synthase-like methyltransferase
VRAPLSIYARRKKLEYFFSFVDKSDRILEVGCADGWVGRYALANGWTNYVGIDLAQPSTPPAYSFVRGDINDWASLGLSRESFDAVVAFEVVEHGDFLPAISDLLREDGKLFVTTPVPERDWVCKILEFGRVNQRRTSPHSHLIHLSDFPPTLTPVEISIKGGLSQWGVFRKATPADERPP